MEEQLFDYYSTAATFNELGSDGQTAWQSPSNIALVKYWGKHGKQLPNNSSVSFTLRNARTETTVRYRPSQNGLRIVFRFEGKPETAFAAKIERFFEQIMPAFPFLRNAYLEIDSTNSFPHSSGIASSASSMSALVMCLIDIERKHQSQPQSDEWWLQKASYFSRLASGSASRSVFPLAALWGNSAGLPGSSALFAVPLHTMLHPVFRTYRDSILIISAGTKSVSSRAGHALMENNPYAAARYQLAENNTTSLLEALASGDIETMIRITESEALQLHALMMTSFPPFILMEASTLSAIKLVRQFREDSGIPLCFTLDAGPNLHLLYPQEFEGKVKAFISSQLLEFCQDGRVIHDETGPGPSAINISE